MVELAPVSASRSVPFMADPVDEAVDSDSPNRESAARGRFKISSSVFSSVLYMCLDLEQPNVRSEISFSVFSSSSRDRAKEKTKL